ncbi:hypothetical protein [Alkaliphilus transvaalensis]|uniref:hypothetical protein n=1 Tax=Alkaliphilus transvaalensis TaxID=114628 RepID=UPI0012EC65BE|nr:hypothetical protein [Alkaliphilus transvaalensis]
MSRKTLGLVAFIATGAGLLGETILQGLTPLSKIGVFAIIGLFIIGIAGHYKELSK